jgi:hypothetical protein
MSEDVERNAGSQNGPVEETSEPVSGYPAIADVMVEHPDFMIFQRFRVLNAKNLLYLQAEICHIEAEMKKRELQWKLAADHSTSYRLNDWPLLTKDEKYLQWVHKLRVLLKEYSMLY